MTRRPLLLLLSVGSLGLFGFEQPGAEAARWAAQARNVTIVRDNWGIAHVSGKTDADAVFGAIYAQAEDDFNRVETNYITALGRTAEAEGEAKIFEDLRMKMYIDPSALKTQYAASPAWLRKLMDAWADGLNYYLAKHTDVRPKVIRRFEPWMALSFTEGSIGGDIERINLKQLEDFYGKGLTQMASIAPVVDPGEPGGSNGAAIAPSNTAGKHALLLINPHTSFFFRSELQMASEEGLNAYGAATWGQFFIYQGFNDRTGWMHTSSGVDSIDEYIETVVKTGNSLSYKYGAGSRPMTVEKITVPFRTASGMSEKTFTVYKTHHGPVIRSVGENKWITIRLMQEPVKALTQSYMRTKARSYKAFVDTMQLRTNSSNNTIYADADGNIAYFHGNFLPRRDTRFDWTKPVDGSDPATEWNGLHALKDLPSLFNPASGWLYNANNSPWSAAGESSPKKADYPAYVENGTESARGLHAIRVLSGPKNFTVDSLLAAAYDSYLPWFEKTIPALLKAYDAAPDPGLAQQIAVLRKWDFRWSMDSVATSLAVFWGEQLRQGKGVSLNLADSVVTRPEFMLQCLTKASAKLETDFGKWNTPWGDINRFQRLTADIVHPFNDAGASIPVGFTSSMWGSLASFAAKAYPQTRKWYGTSGNSFVAVVEFGDRVRARAVSAGGESGHAGAPHFNDQAQRYSTGDLREVYFYPDQLKGHSERQYHPGAE